MIDLRVNQAQVHDEPESKEGGRVVPLQLLGHFEVYIDVILGVELFERYKNCLITSLIKSYDYYRIKSVQLAAIIALFMVSYGRGNLIRNRAERGTTSHTDCSQCQG